MWNGKMWAPAAQQSDGSWGVDMPAMVRMGLAANAAPLSTSDQKQVADLRTAADSVGHAAAITGDFMVRNGRTPTGGAYAIPGVPSIAKAFSGSDSDLTAMDRDSASLAPLLRAPGQRLTQMEWMQNLRSGPSIKNAEPQNKQAAQAIYDANTLAQAQASFWESYLNNKRTLAGVVPAWNAWKAQHFAADGSYSHDPLTPQQAASAALKTRSAQAGPAMLKPSDYLGAP
jgi:hypothetical protein